MKLAYYSEYNDINENRIRVEIFRDTEDDIVPAELTLAAGAVSIEYSSDNIFKPLKLSGCSILVLTKEVLEDLYTGRMDEIQVRIYKNGSLFWVGYKTPNLYSLEYENDFDLLTVECIDFISLLDNIPYTYIEGVNNIVSFWDIMLYILNTVDADRLINKVYVHKVINYKIEQLSLLERNFFDEEGEAELMKEVLEDILAYLGMTMLQYLDSFYLVDSEGFKAGINDFVIYDRTTLTTSDVVLDMDSRNLEDIGIGSSNCTISMGDVYNKINLIANTNSINDLIPDAVDNDDDIVNQNDNPNKIYESTVTIDKVDYTLLNGYFKSNGNYYSDSVYSGSNGILEPEQYTEVTGDNIDKITDGDFWQKCSHYKTEDGEPASITWDSYLTSIHSGYFNQYIDYSITRLLNKPMTMYKGGYMVINMKYKLSTYNKANSVFKTLVRNLHQNGNIEPTFSNTQYGLGFEDTRFPCRLTIGDDWYYNGDEWVTYDEYNAKVAAGYFDLGTLGESSNLHSATWYKVMNNGYWKYVNEADYNASTALKETGSYDRRLGVFYIDVDGAGMPNDNSIFVEENYYHECFLRDRFYLVHTNKDGDKVFEAERNLDNTVSWKMELSDSGEGLAIKMPDNVLTGLLGFELYTPNHLGAIPCPRTDIENVVCKAVHISELSLIYTSSDTVKSIYTGEHYEPDVLYSNTVNESYVTAMDDIKLKVNTYNPKATSYSYVLDIDKLDFVVETTYYPTTATNKLEYHIIDKYIGHYSSPKFQYSNTINNIDITPFSIINTMGRDMLVNLVSYDLFNDVAQIELIEL